MGRSLFRPWATGDAIPARLRPLLVGRFTNGHVDITAGNGRRASAAVIACPIRPAGPNACWTSRFGGSRLLHRLRSGSIRARKGVAKTVESRSYALPPLPIQPDFLQPEWYPPHSGLASSAADVAALLRLREELQASPPARVARFRIARPSRSVTGSRGKMPRLCSDVSLRSGIICRNLRAMAVKRHFVLRRRKTAMMPSIQSTAAAGSGTVVTANEPLPATLPKFCFHVSYCAWPITPPSTSLGSVPAAAPRLSRHTV